jgi:hypothetical protein
MTLYEARRTLHLFDLAILNLRHAADHDEVKAAASKVEKMLTGIVFALDALNAAVEPNLFDPHRKIMVGGKYVEQGPMGFACDDVAADGGSSRTLPEEPQS